MMRRPRLRIQPSSTGVGMPRLMSSLTARGVRPSPQTFSRGKYAFSRRRTSRPAIARYAAVVEPDGPAPTTMTSARSVVTVDPLEVSGAGVVTVAFGVCSL